AAHRGGCAALGPAPAASSCGESLGRVAAAAAPEHRAGTCGLTACPAWAHRVYADRRWHGVRLHGADAVRQAGYGHRGTRATTARVDAGCYHYRDWSRRHAGW